MNSEKLTKPIYEERCNVAYQNRFIPIRMASNIDLGTVSFYEDYMVVSFVGSTVIKYDEIELKIKERFWFMFGNYFTITRTGSRIKIIIKPKNFEKMKKIFLSKITPRRTST